MSKRLVASAIGKHTDEKGKETCYFDTYIPFFQFQRFLFFFNFAKGTTVSRVRFTPFPSSRSSLEGARSRGARCSLKKRKKEKKKRKRKKKREKGKKFISRLLVLLGVILVPVLHGRCFRSVFRNESTITTGAYSSTLREIHACWLSAMRHSRTRLKKNTLIEVSAWNYVIQDYFHPR